MSLADDLERLAQLHQRGALTEDEFQRAKARLLSNETPPRVIAAVQGLRRSRDDAWMGGVCGGLARSTGLDAWIWRLMFMLLVLCAGTGVLAYGLMWLLVPRDDAPWQGPQDRLHAG